MPPNKRPRPARRNAKATAKRRHRNAAPPTTQRLPTAKVVPTSARPTTGEKLLDWGESLVGSAVVTLLGSQMVKWGLSPMYVSLGAVGLGSSLSLIPKNEHLRKLGNGASGAAVSQLTLLAFNPAPAPKVVSAAAPPPQSLLPAQPQPAKPAPKPAQPGQFMNADVGALPPGMLDAAFERARAELALQSDGNGYEPAPRFHHGPVMP